MLLCYLPPQLVDLADQAVQRNELECLTWVDPANVLGRRPNSANLERVLG